LLGSTVQYIPGSKNARTPVTFSFDLKDQNGSTTPVVTVIAAGNGSHTLTGAASGYTDISLGKGNNTINLSGSKNAVALLSGSDVVHGGNGDTISIAGNTRLAIHGTDEMVFVAGGNVAIDDLSTRLHLSIGPTIDHAVISGFALDPNGAVDLTGGLGMPQISILAESAKNKRARPGAQWRIPSGDCDTPMRGGWVKQTIVVQGGLADAKRDAVTWEFVEAIKRAGTPTQH
jgi:hypothetical protein